MSKKTDRRAARPLWPLAVFLILASATPLAAGAYRGTTLLLDGLWRFEWSPTRVDPLPLFLHVTASAVFFVLTALQVWPPLRKKYPRWHRTSGRIAIVAGLTGALSSIWITLVHSEVRGEILYTGRLIFGPLWGLFLVLALAAARRRDIPAHRAWAIRAFAVSMPAGTLIFIFAPIFVIFGEVTPTVDESIQVAAWIGHLSIAEYILRRTRRSRMASNPANSATDWQPAEQPA